MPDDELLNRVESLENEIEILDTSINSLKTSVDTLSDRYVKSYESALAIQGQGDSYDMDESYVWTKDFANADDEEFVGSICYDSSSGYFYAVTFSNFVNSYYFVKFKERSSTVTTIKSNVTNAYGTMTWNSSTNTIWAAEYVPARVSELNPSTGDAITTLDVYSQLGHTISFIWGICYNRDDGRTILIYSDNSHNYIFGILNLSTGEIIDEQSVGTTYFLGGLMFQRGLFFASHSYGGIAQFRVMYPYDWQDAIDNGLPAPSRKWINDVCADSESFKIYAVSGSQLLVGIIVARVKTEIYDGNSSITVDDGGSSLTVDGSLTSNIANATHNAHNSVSVGTSVTSIVSSRTNRRGIVIYNQSSSATIYVGGSGVTTSNGMEILPKSSIVINNYGGSLYAISTVSSTDVRYLEVW